jgi:hypothetical protein
VYGRKEEGTSAKITFVIARQGHWETRRMEEVADTVYVGGCWHLATEMQR